MYANSRFTSLYSGNQHDTVKQLNSNKMEKQTGLGLSGTQGQISE